MRFRALSSSSTVGGSDNAKRMRLITVDVRCPTTSNLSCFCIESRLKVCSTRVDCAIAFESFSIVFFKFVDEAALESSECSLSALLTGLPSVALMRDL